MAEEKVVNTEATETPVQEPTPEPVKTESAPAQSGEAVKETPKEVPTDKVPYSRFSEVIAEKNELKRKAQEYEAKIKEYEIKFKPQAPVEDDPFASLLPEEREQTKKFIDQFVKPSVKKEILQEMSPFIQEVQHEKLNKQINEAKTLANKVGINFDERLPEVVDYLSRPENKGRLTAKEALLSLYGDEILEKTTQKAKESYSQETKELIEKKKLANMQAPNVNPNVVIKTDEMARKNLNATERLQKDIADAMELARQGVKNPKVRVE